MADVGVWIKNANIQAKAGINANTTSKAVAATDVYVLEIENYINTVTRYNWSDNYAGLNVDVKYLLMNVGSDLAAMYVIVQDMSGFTSRQEAQTMLDFLRDRVNEGIKLLQDKVNTDFMKAA